jgi:hypothetical protein
MVEAFVHTIGCLQAVYKEAGKELPTDPWEQLLLGVIAVFKWVKLIYHYLYFWSHVLAALFTAQLCMRPEAAY